jgi:hypothetical protein
MGKSLRIGNGRQEAPCPWDCFAVFEQSSPKLPGSRGDGDLRLAGDSDLAEAAGGRFYIEPGLSVFFRDAMEIGEAFLFVMSLPADGACRAPLHAFAAAPVEVEEAVRMVIVVGPLRRRDGVAALSWPGSPSPWA